MQMLKVTKYMLQEHLVKKIYENIIIQKQIHINVFYFTILFIIAVIKYVKSELWLYIYYTKTPPHIFMDTDKCNVTYAQKPEAALYSNNSTCKINFFFWFWFCSDLFFYFVLVLNFLWCYNLYLETK